MAKKKDMKPPREMTKRQLTRWEQQKRRARIALYSGIVIVVAVVALIVSGWYIERYRPLRQVMLRVNGTEFTVSDYITMLKYFGRSQPEYIPYLADQVTNAMKEAALVEQGALKLGIGIEETEVDKELETRKLGQEYRDIVRTELISSALRSTYFDELVPENGEQRQILAMFLESETQSNEVKARLEKGEQFAEIASQLSLDSYTKTNKGDLGWRPKGVLQNYIRSTLLEEKLFSSPVGMGTLNDPEASKSVGYLLVKMLDTQDGGKQAHLQAILLGSKEEADKIKARITAGEDFTALAKEFSQLSGAKDNGGDMGWVTPGTYTKQVDDFLFSPATPQFATSDPIRDETRQTKGGWWLYDLKAIESRPIEGDNRNILTNKLFTDWTKELSADPNNKIEILLTEQQKTFAIKEAQKS